MNSYSSRILATTTTRRDRSFRAVLSLGWYDITIFGLFLISGVGAFLSILGM